MKNFVESAESYGGQRGGTSGDGLARDEGRWKKLEVSSIHDRVYVSSQLSEIALDSSLCRK